MWFPTALTFGAVSLAFIGPDQKWDQALSANNMFVLAIVLAIYWLATFIAFRGVEAFAKVSKWGGIIGTIIPAAILIVLGFAYLFGGGAPQIELSWKQGASRTSPTSTTWCSPPASSCSTPAWR